jgi:hypothetical protein
MGSAQQSRQRCPHDRQDATLPAQHRNAYRLCSCDSKGYPSRVQAPSGCRYPLAGVVFSGAVGGAPVMTAQGPYFAALSRSRTGYGDDAIRSPHKPTPLSVLPINQRGRRLTSRSGAGISQCNTFIVIATRYAGIQLRKARRNVRGPHGIALATGVAGWKCEELAKCWNAPGQ